MSPESAEPRGRPGLESDLRAAAPPFPRPLGAAFAGDDRGGVVADARTSCGGSSRRSYRPNGAILGVAGAIDWPELRDSVGRLFGDWKAQPVPQVVERPAGPHRDHIVRETQQIQIALAYPAATVVSPDYYRARAATAILGGYSSARLFTEVREKRGLCYSVYAAYEGQLERAAMLCYAGTSTDRAQQTLDVVLDEIERLGAFGCGPRRARDDAGGPQELADHGAGIEHEPFGLARFRLVFPGKGPADRRDRRRARRALARGGLGVRGHDREATASPRS